MSGRLDTAAHEWMTAPGARAVMAALDAARPPGHDGDVARYVGGCVRNTLLGVDVDDVDIATVLEPAAVVAALKTAGLKAVPTGLEHGTVTAVAQGVGFEVTTLRRDVETDGRRAVVAYTTDWAEDAARRDFRLNAIYASVDGALFDPHDGAADARAGRIVFIGDAETRIREDYLRILRFFRFHAWYGRGEPDAAGLAACAALKAGIAQLSAERVWKELRKLLAAPDPVPAMEAMAETGVLAETAPEAGGLDTLRALVELEGVEGWRVNPLRRLMALTPGDPLVARRLAGRLKMANVECSRLAARADLALEPDELLQEDEAAWARALYFADAAGARDAARLAWAEAGASDRPDARRALIAFADRWTPPMLPIAGRDLIAAGMSAGPDVGAALRALEALWVNGGFRADKKSLLEALPIVRGK